ncbi:MAG: M48 family metalloprotease [Sinobacteraceae bacterium]|nr:M48 family metalloprotease [Nevskiaceae bacterium]MCP5470635.1 M48 family metalloprotease [Nevskiaceae bacterium]
MPSTPRRMHLSSVFAAALILCAGVLPSSLLVREAAAQSSSRTAKPMKESETSRRAHAEIIKAYGVYEDQAIQDYVSEVGQRVARVSDLPANEFKFLVIDDESINAFTTGCCYVYVHRGLLLNLNSEAELASVLGHEVAHVTARHPQKRQRQGILATVLATGAAIATGSSAVAQLANIGAGAWLQGYGRENELEADRLGLIYSAKAGYRPEAMAETFEMFKRGESFEIARARAEGREPRIYHGLFSSHPAPNARVIQAAKGAAKLEQGPPGGWVDHRDEYLRKLDGMVYGSSRAQGIVRDNRFYHADMGITLAFPRGWTVENQRDRLLAYTVAKDTIMQLTVQGAPPNQSPREFLLTFLRGSGGSVVGGEQFNSNGLDGYTATTTGGSPLDGGTGPVRWIVLYRGGSAYIFAGASKSSRGSVPEADGLFRSVAQTMRSLKPAEYPLAEPYRIRVRQATETTDLATYADAVPVEKYQKEELLLINGLYPDKKVQPGMLYKVVE